MEEVRRRGMKHTEEEILITFLSENLKGRNYLENRNVDGRVILN
jgi:hypothetical protein